MYVYLEDPIGLDGALRGKKHKKRILREKLGNDVVTTYDERKRMLVVCGVDDQKVSSYFNLFFLSITHTGQYSRRYNSIVSLSMKITRSY